MTTSYSQRAPDNFEEPLRAAHDLVRNGKREEACRFLLQHKERAESTGDLDDAALYSSVRGSYLVIIGADEEALEAYREAERLSGHDVHYQLTVARHLVQAMLQPRQALESVNALVKYDSDNPEVSESEIAAVRQEAHVIRGLSFLALGRPKGAIEELREVKHIVARGVLHPLSCDLTLVEELIRRHLVPRVCMEYLELVGAKARAASEERVLQKVDELRELVSSAGRSSEN